MASQITEYKCPACTGPLHFVGESGKLECDFCGSAFDVAEIEALYADKEQAAQAATAEAEAKEQSGDGWDCAAAGEEWGEDALGMKEYNCPSCGAQLICDATTAATSCPYCGNNTIVPGQFGGTLKPDYIIPFKLDKEAAKRALREHYKGKPLLPKTFSAANHIDEIRGVYVPFWLFDGMADADMSFAATRSHSHREGDYQVTVTEHYNVRRAGTVEFERIPVDAATKMPDEYMDSVEPFDYGELKPFSTAYLPGFLADKYDVSAEEASSRADDRAASSAVGFLTSTVMGYESVIPIHEDVRLQRGKVSYALMPVWMLNTKWKGKDFLFAMNGQTGKLIGNLPVSWGRFWTWFACIAIPVAAAISAFLLS